MPAGAIKGGAAVVKTQHFRQDELGMSVTNEASNALYTSTAAKVQSHGFRHCYHTKEQSERIYGVLYNSKRGMIMTWDTKSVKLWRGNKLIRKLIFPFTQGNFIRHAIYEPEYDVFFAVTGDNCIKTLNYKLVFQSSVNCKGTVLCLKYSKARNVLISAGVHGVSIWKYGRKYGAMDFQLTPKAHIPHPRAQWITLLEVDDSRESELAPGVVDGTFRLFCVCSTQLTVIDGDTGKIMKDDMELHQEKVTSCLYYPPMDYLITSSNDSTVKVWQAHGEHAMLFCFTRHTRPVTMIKWHRTPTAGTDNVDDAFVLSISLDRTLRVWNVDTHEELYTLNTDSQLIGIDMMANMGGQFVLSSFRHFSVWALSNVYHLFARSSALITSVSRSTRVCVMSDDDTIRIHSKKDGKHICTALPHVSAATLRHFAFSPAEDLLFTLLDTGVISVLSTKTHPCFLIQDWNHSPEHKPVVLAVGSEDKGTKKSVGRFLSTDALDNEGDANDKEFLISGNQDGSITFWDFKGNVISHVRAHRNPIKLLEYNAEEDTMVTITNRNEVKVWERARTMHHNRPLHTLQFPMQRPQQTITAAIFFRSTVVIGTKAGLVDIVDTQTGTIKSLDYNDDHATEVTGVAVLARQELFATSSADQMIKLWTTGKRLLHSIEMPEPVSHIKFLNEIGDLLICMGNTIHILYASAFLPEDLYDSDVSDDEHIEEDIIDLFDLGPEAGTNLDGSRTALWDGLQKELGPRRTIAQFHASLRAVAKDLERNKGQTESESTEYQSKLELPLPVPPPLPPPPPPQAPKPKEVAALIEEAPPPPSPRKKAAKLKFESKLSFDFTTLESPTLTRQNSVKSGKDLANREHAGVPRAEGSPDPLAFMCPAPLPTPPGGTRPTTANTISADGNGKIVFSLPKPSFLAPAKDENGRPRYQNVDMSDLFTVLHESEMMKVPVPVGYVDPRPVSPEYVDMFGGLTNITDLMSQPSGTSTSPTSAFSRAGSTPLQQYNFNQSAGSAQNKPSSPLKMTLVESEGESETIVSSEGEMEGRLHGMLRELSEENKSGRRKDKTGHSKSNIARIGRELPKRLLPAELADGLASTGEADHQPDPPARTMAVPAFPKPKPHTELARQDSNVSVSRYSRGNSKADIDVTLQKVNLSIPKQPNEKISSSTLSVTKKKSPRVHEDKQQGQSGTDGVGAIGKMSNQERVAKSLQRAAQKGILGGALAVTGKKKKEQTRPPDKSGDRSHSAFPVPLVINSQTPVSPRAVGYVMEKKGLLSTDFMDFAEDQDPSELSGWATPPAFAMPEEAPLTKREKERLKFKQKHREERERKEALFYSQQRRRKDGVSLLTMGSDILGDHPTSMRVTPSPHPHGSHNTPRAHTTHHSVSLPSVKHDFSDGEWSDGSVTFVKSEREYKKPRPPSQGHGSGTRRRRGHGHGGEKPGGVIHNHIRGPADVDDGGETGPLESFEHWMVSHKLARGEGGGYITGHAHSAGDLNAGADLNKVLDSFRRMLTSASGRGYSRFLGATTSEIRSKINREMREVESQLEGPEEEYHHGQYSADCTCSLCQSQALVKKHLHSSSGSLGVGIVKPQHPAVDNNNNGTGRLVRAKTPQRVSTDLSLAGVHIHREKMLRELGLHPDQFKGEEEVEHHASGAKTARGKMERSHTMDAKPSARFGGKVLNPHEFEPSLSPKPSATGAGGSETRRGPAKTNPSAHRTKRGMIPATPPSTNPPSSSGEVVGGVAMKRASRGDLRSRERERGSSAGASENWYV